jgi:hypothetical protein
MHDAREPQRERSQRDDAENAGAGEDKEPLAEVARPTQAESNPGPITVTIADLGVTNGRARRDPTDDGQMHD